MRRKDCRALVKTLLITWPQLKLQRTKRGGRAGILKNSSSSGLSNGESEEFVDFDFFPISTCR
jgi:hypothetical protein